MATTSTLAQSILPQPAAAGKTKKERRTDEFNVRVAHRKYQDAAEAQCKLDNVEFEKFSVHKDLRYHELMAIAAAGGNVPLLATPFTPSSAQLQPESQ